MDSYRQGSFKSTDLGIVSLNIDVDLSSYFNWNTKMLFVSAVVEYAQDSFPLNQAVIWDEIVRDKEDAVIKIKNLKREYPVYDILNALHNKQANLTLQCHIIPWVGFMSTERHVVPNAVVFPSSVYKK